MPAAIAEHAAQDIDARRLLKALKAFRRGDFSARLEVSGGGIAEEIAETFNEVIELNAMMTEELARVSAVVGKEGKIAERARLGTVTGAWAASIDSVNTLIGDMVQPTTEVARVIGAVAKGDLSQTMVMDINGRPLRGEFRRIGRVVNTMVDQLNSFASEVTRVAREVGTEGKLGGQAKVKGVAGTWKDLTDNVNSMAANLTGQVRNIAEVTTAVATGDLSKKITVDARGEIQELKNTINTMVDQLNSFASEVTRVAREVGTEGKLGGQAEVKGVAGTWKDLTDNVNSMAANLTGQVRNIADVTTAVANGDLSKKITVDVKGEILELKNTINTMVDQLNSFASEVTRVAREVGTEGKLGGQAEVKGVAGTWKDLTDNVNSMAGNLTGQVRNIAEVTTAVANGDLSKKITVNVRGEILELKNTINTMVDQLGSFASEVSRVAREVGTEGKLGGQAEVDGVAGTWKDLTDNVNSMAANLTGQVRNIAEVTTAVANGDLSKKITVNVKGEILELKNTINTMVDQLNSFASEVTRVAREVGTEGKLGGQAEVKGVAGTWKDLTDNVNSMAANLTGQVRNIAEVTTAVANGDLSKKITVDVRGEILELKNTINTMVDQLGSFASEVTRVAREVGSEGMLGGQAKVPGAAGLWRDLTDNVNQLADNLTTQVRAIAEVATAVTKGDLTRSIMVQASGEVAALKDNINEMIRNLKDTTLKNKEQDWLKTNIAKLTKMLQGQRDLLTVSRLILSEIAPLVEAQHGVFYVMKPDAEEPVLDLMASYAYRERQGVPKRFRLGEGLVGQCAYEGAPMVVSDVPPNYIAVNSALGEAAPFNIIVLPVLFEGEVKAVIELASFHRFSETHQLFLDQLMESIGIVLNTIEANMRTEDLLKQSQSLTGELQSQQEEMRKTNDRLEQQAENLRKSEELLKAQQEELQKTNSELEEKARLLSEQKAQLSAASKYKSQFLANMSHELRTPLNSLLILAKLLSENSDKNLSEKQVEFAKTIHAAGSDLLSLINDIFDLSKIESGTVTLDIGKERLADMRDYVERTFQQMAQDKGIAFPIEVDPNLPQSIYTDAKRLQQIFKNLLSNAFKFTEKGRVAFRMQRVTSGWNTSLETLNRADSVIAFSVSDTGIGIPADKQKIIFEAFQQADGTTSRKYGGTGLGLSISREIARRLGGEIVVDSRPGEGSTFTLYLPSSSRVQAAAWRPQPTRKEPADAIAEDTAGGAYLSLLEQNEVSDDRDSIQDDDRILLIVEPDAHYARAALALARGIGFKGLIALRGDAGLAMARKAGPDAILLNAELADMHGWGVLDLLKHDPDTRHIPVHMLVSRLPRHRGLCRGALGCHLKPRDPSELAPILDDTLAFIRAPNRAVLWVGPAEGLGAQLAELLGEPPLEIREVPSAQAAERALEVGGYVSLVVNLDLPDAVGFIRRLRAREKGAHLPIIAYGKEPTDEGRGELEALVGTVVVQDENLRARLANEIALMAHRRMADLPEHARDMLSERRRVDHELAGSTVLVVDDDIRNIYSLTSILEEYDMEVLYAENGRDGIRRLEDHEDIDLVIMDVMMPELDGYDTMRMIRERERFRDLPIIALTAKAMKGDREKCIEVGASDYMAKPIDVMQLLSLLRIWLKR
ncbi:HAMP domain-containing protein [Ectothiorhodospiraceae bacterium 2226]|nr:HAMP domain-containing protein [Ectothiorhodospiraceae bacterium 2226]